MPRKKGYKSKVPNADAAGRIRVLATYREQPIKERGSVPIWTAACNFVGIHSTTVLRHAPELAKSWYDKDFHS